MKTKTLLSVLIVFAFLAVGVWSCKKTKDVQPGGAVSALNSSGGRATFCGTYNWYTDIAGMRYTEINIFAINVLPYGQPPSNAIPVIFNKLCVQMGNSPGPSSPSSWMNAAWNNSLDLMIAALNNGTLDPTAGAIKQFMLSRIRAYFSNMGVSGKVLEGSCEMPNVPLNDVPFCN